MQTFSLTIALWPVLNEAEANAVHLMVYNFAWNETLYPPAGNEFIVTMRDTGDDAYSMHPPGELKRQPSVPCSASPIEYRDSSNTNRTNSKLIFQNSAAICTPSPAWGFCRDPKFPAFKIFMVDPDRRTDPAAIRRGNRRPGSSVPIHYRV